MKIRTDFVTNSSSSSFILGTPKELTDKQKEVIIKYVTEHMLGEVKASSKKELDELIRLDDLCCSEDRVPEIVKSLKNGKVIREGTVDFEENCVIRELFQGLWKAIKDADSKEIDLIDTDLIY